MFVDFCAFDFWQWVFNVADAAVVVDVYSNLAAHTAVSQEELAVAMSKTASSMEGVGATFEEASAELSTLRLLSSHFKDAWIYENKANKK